MSCSFSPSISLKMSVFDVIDSTVKCDLKKKKVTCNAKEDR